MKKLFVCISHTMTSEQEQGWEQITLVSSDVKKRTSQISPMATLDEIKKLASEVVSEAVACGATHILCAGEPTLALHVALQAHGLGIVPTQSTTRRESQDVVQPDGSILKTAVFKHVQWRDMF